MIQQKQIRYLYAVDWWRMLGLSNLLTFERVIEPRWTCFLPCYPVRGPAETRWGLGSTDCKALLRAPQSPRENGSLQRRRWHQSAHGRLLSGHINLNQETWGKIKISAQKKRSKNVRRVALTQLLVILCWVFFTFSKCNTDFRCGSRRTIVVFLYEVHQSLSYWVRTVTILNKQASNTCRWCASVGGNGPVSSMRAELQQMVVEAILWGVTSYQQNRGVSTYR